VRTCASCGRENPNDADFCSCGEYLRWEPTNFMPAVSAPAAVDDGAGVDSAPPAPVLDPNVTIAPNVLRAGLGVPGGRGATPGGPDPAGPPPGAAALTLHLADETESSGPIHVSVEPGQQTTILATIRNQSQVVDNFDISVRGVPVGWWTATPATAYLVPYGTGGTYEQEIQIHLHPPRSPEAQARAWPLEVIATSRAYASEVAAAPANLTVGPYFDIATELHPERASGRLKARYRLVVRNRANARTEVALAAEDTDAECRFRFADTKIVLEAGNAMECPFTVLPPSQIWLGRASERRFQVTATPLGTDAPVPPRMGVYRQRAWLPWWLSILAAVAVALAVVVIKLLPQQTVIPKVTGLPSMFAAQKLLNQDGFSIAPKAAARAAGPGRPAGSIADQSPAAGVKAKKGALVTLVVYTGSGKVTVPSVTGDTPGLADQALRAISLALGAVSPQPLNPNGTIASQIPLAGTKVTKGATVAVFLAPATSTSTTRSGAAAKAAAASAAAGAAGAGATASAKSLNAAAGQAGTGSIAVPVLAGDPTTAAGKLSQLGLQPKLLKEVSQIAPGQVAGTVPKAGAKLAKGAVVDLLISTGSPQLSFDNGQVISVTDPTTQKVSGIIPAGTGPQVEATWSPDGTHLIYSQDGQLVLDQPNVKGAKPFQLTQPQGGSSDLNPAFAPTLKSLTVAFIRRTATSAQLCLARITQFALSPSCTSAPGWDLGGDIDWSPDGSTLLVLGTRNHGANFGILAFTSSVPFSANGSDWGHGTLQTNASVAGQGVYEAVIGPPPGKQMALVAGSVTQGFNLYVVPTGQFSYTPAQQLPGVQACQVAWRGDGQELAVMQPHGLCGPDALGTIVAVAPAHPGTSTILATVGAHPAWQPIPTSSS
jgi:beta-lactam-binding protein with PASTA domain